MIETRNAFFTARYLEVLLFFFLAHSNHWRGKIINKLKMSVKNRLFEKEKIVF